MTNKEAIEIVSKNSFTFLYDLGKSDGVSEGYQIGKADVIDKIIKSLEAQFLMQNNPNSKFVETIVLHRDFIDELEQLKENK